MSRIDVIQSITSDFLGPCEVCGKTLHTYRGVAGHLRWNKDPHHAGMRERWREWRLTYRRVLHCRKCGQAWEIFAKAQKDQKRCPSCVAVRASVGKKVYEGLPTMCAAKVDQARVLQWVPGDELYREIARSIREHRTFLDAANSLSVSYKVFKAIGEHILGVEGYRDWARQKKIDTARANVAAASKASVLEEGFASHIRDAGVTGLAINQWQTLTIDGERVVRQADIKIRLSDGRKVVVLCDGEVFHGPRFIFGPPQERIENDVKTARAYYDLGYSVLRYSESEIRSGHALAHLLHTLERLKAVHKILRLWHPQIEEAA